MIIIHVIHDYIQKSRVHGMPSRAGYHRSGANDSTSVRVTQVGASKFGSFSKHSTLNLEIKSWVDDMAVVLL